LNSPAEITTWLDQVLPSIQKPGRYYGGELNQVMKKWDDVDIHVALAFPDIYDLGMPNLGLAILYDSINKRPDALAERAYSPWLDMEAALRRDKIPLHSLESRHPLEDFEILGISLPYETLYTNALNLLDLSGLPVKSKDRLEIHPLIIAGGHAVTNPEPMAPFIDAFAIGDGEEIIHEIIDRIKFGKQNSVSRKELLISLAQISGVYIPIFYKPIYHLDGMLETIKPKFKSIPPRVQKRIIAKLPPPISDFIVPSIDIVHNRISVEIMRGCTRGCRFCHAGMITRPVRERSVEQIINSIETALNKTGYEEIALLSLSSSDYTHIQELVNEISSRFKGKHLTISLPSLRIESLSIDLLQKLIESRQSSFTLAPEAGSDNLRNRINKPIPERALLDLAYEIYSRGWLTIKLYFMIGLPGESEDDVRAVARICKAVISEGRKVHGNKASLHISIGTFVPKPHTPFQWEPLEKKETIEIKHQILRHELRLPGIKVSWPDQKNTLLESWLSRGDRRISEVIYKAWSLGAKFDAWQDHSRYEIWESAFSESKVDPDFSVHRRREEKEYFPWDIVDIGVKKSFLLQDNKWSQEGKPRPDCREHCYACGILPAYSSIRSLTPDAYWLCPHAEPDDLSW
jgi:radical SAM family uncharacterized protein